MARLPRLSLPGHLHHVIQRGNNRQPIFGDALDFEFMCKLVADTSHQAGVVLHAYVLMENHFHLLATPATEDALGLMMQGIGRRYVRYYNQRHGRSGTLWDGRYRCTVLQAEAWLLPCMAHLDLHPVRAGLVDRPQDWVWSSHRHYAGVEPDRLLTPHPLLWSLGNTPFAREQAYVHKVDQGVTSAQQQALGDAVLHGWALGDPGFVEALQKRTHRRLSRGQPGRPRRAQAEPA
jgi:putative transposase